MDNIEKTTLNDPNLRMIKFETPVKYTIDLKTYYIIPLVGSVFYLSIITLGANDENPRGTKEAGGREVLVQSSGRREQNC